jgi:serine protease Do
MIARACAVLALLVALAGPAAALDLGAIHAEVERALPREALESLGAPPPLVLRRAINPREAIYNQRVDGVVLLASTRTVASGVLVSEAGDIVTSEHLVQQAHRAAGEDWIAVWFHPVTPTAPALARPSFVLARVAQRDPRRDLARLRLVQPVPDTATVVPLGSMVPAAGKKVFTIGHPKSAGWTFGEGVVADVRPGFQWRYDDGITRSATAIQLSAPIATGSSGGPLFDERGAMVGVVVAAGGGTPGVGFAVAVQHVHELLQAGEAR